MRPIRYSLRCLLLLTISCATLESAPDFSHEAIRAGLSPDSSHAIVLDIARVQANNEWTYYVIRVDDEQPFQIVDSINTAARLSWCDNHTLFWMEQQSRGLESQLFGEKPCAHLITFHAEDRQVDTVASLCHDGALGAYGTLNKQTFRLIDSIFCFQAYRADHRWLSVVAKVTADGSLDTLQTFLNAGMPEFCNGFRTIAVEIRADRARWPGQQSVVVLESATGKERYRAIHAELSLVDPVVRSNDGRLYCRAVDSNDNSFGIVCYDNRRFTFNTIWRNSGTARIESWYLDGDSLRVFLAGERSDTAKLQQIAVSLD